MEEILCLFFDQDDMDNKDDKDDKENKEDKDDSRQPNNLTKDIESTASKSEKFLRNFTKLTLNSLFF